MEQNKIIHSCNLAGYRPIIWRGEAVIKRENQIRSVLKEKLGEEYSELFSSIVLNSEITPGQASASWMSSYINPKTSFKKLKESEQTKVRAKLQYLISRISDLCKELKASGDKENEELSEIIQLATRIPSEDCILTDGEKITLVLWGFINDAADVKGVDLMVFLGYVFPEVTLHPEPPLIKKEENIVPPQTPVEPQKTVTQQTVQTPVNITTPATTQVKKKRKFKWWWLLIILGALLLLLLLFFLLKGCNRHSFLPDHPGIVLPIDTNQIIKNPGDTLQRPVIGNRLNVILDKKADIQKFAADFDSKFNGDAKIVYYDTIIKQLQIEFYTGDIPSWKQKIKALPGVRIVFEESIFHTNYAPGDPAFKSNIDNYYFEAIKAYGGWDVTKGVKTIKIAIIDDGFDLNHPELKGRFVDPWNIVENSANVGTNGGKSIHGTHVACLAAGNIDNSSGASGIAPECILIPVQISDANGDMSTTYIINGILYAINKGASVINLSLGMRWPGFVKNMSSAEQEELARTLYPEEAEFWDEMYSYAEDYNVVVVQAAGNDDVLSTIDPMKRSEKTIVVASSDQHNAKSDFSNYGTHTDVTAPGTEIYSAIPGNKFALFDGTSMASPMVAGAAGLLLSVNNSLKPEDIKKILAETGIQVTTAAGEPVGPLIQLDKALERAANYKPVSCDDLVDSLLRVIDRLKQKISDPADKMKMPTDALDCNFTKGQWVSSNNLVNSITKVPVQLFFDFNGQCSGTVTYAEQGGTRCQASLKCKIENKKLIMEQSGNASCNDGTEYERYIFDGTPDANGVVNCIARKANSSKAIVKFTLNRL
jgi:serine protease